MPSASLALGWNEYAAPTVAVVAGEPVIVGARFGGACTSIEKLASDALAVPSLTLMTMLLYVATAALPGVPLIVPVTVLNDAQFGRFVATKDKVLPFGSDAVGVKR